MEIKHISKPMSYEDQSCVQLIDGNKANAKQLDFKITEKEKTLPIMYCIFKMYKNSIGASFITASKICSSKQISKSVSNILSP